MSTLRDDEALESVRRAALHRALGSGSWEDLEKAATIASALAEAEKNLSETRDAGRQLQLQLISSLATFLIPVVSLLALFGTIYFQGQQMRETRQENAYQEEMTRDKNEDTQWRDLLTSLRGSPDTFDSDVTVAPRLRSFFASARYGDQARDISIRLMGRLTAVEGFKELFRIVFAEIDPASLTRILDVGRSLNATRLNIETECSNLSAQYQLPKTANFGLCTMAVSVPDLNRAINAPFPQRGIQLREAITGVYAEMLFLSQQIGPYIRDRYPVGAARPPEPLDMSNNDFFSIDLSNVDLSNAKLDGAIFWNADFDGADLRVKSFAGIRLNASNWWDAKAIDQNLLNFLILYDYPLSVDATTYTSPSVPTQDHYTDRIAELCQPARPACAAKNLLFQRPPAAPVAADPSNTGTHPAKPEPSP